MSLLGEGPRRDAGDRRQGEWRRAPTRDDGCMTTILEATP